MKFVYIDTEFTDFHKMDLISIGLVSSSGEKLYLETSDFKIKDCSDFVIENVLPLLNTVKTPYKELKKHVYKWLEDIGQDAETIMIMADYRGDIKLLDKLMSAKYPAKVEGIIDVFTTLEYALADFGPTEVINGDSVGDLYTSSYNDYFAINNLIQHHALNDAESGMNAFKVSLDFIKNRP